MTKSISISTVVAFSLVTFFIMQFRLSPGETPYWMFGIIFLLLLGYLVLEKQQSIILWLLIGLTIGTAMYSAIVVRHINAPILGVHDIILQQEAAIRFLLHGVNPYSATYFGTPMEEWHYSSTEVNPALYHFVMIPWYLIFSLPFYFLSTRLGGFFDGRIPLAFLFLGLLYTAWRLVKPLEKRKLFVILLAFNPATLGYFIEGRADVFMLAFLFLSWFFLEKKKFILATSLLALAFATKQSVWPIFPFYFYYLWITLKNNESPRAYAQGIFFFSLLRSKNKQFFINLSIFAIIFLTIVLPFFFWNPSAFVDSTILYLTGNTAHSYPIAGYGWGMVLKQFGIIKDIHQQYPFIIWQAIFGIPLIAILLKWLKEKPEVWRMILSYGIFTFVFWYFSRYFNNSHVGFLSAVFISAWGFQNVHE